MVAFSFTRQELLTSLTGMTGKAAEELGSVELQTRLVKLDSADFTYELRLETTIDGTTYTVATTILSWESDPFAQLGASYSSSNFSLAAFIDTETVTFTGQNMDEALQVKAAVEFVRTNQVIDTSASEVIAGARGGDIIVMSVKVTILFREA